MYRATRKYQARRRWHPRAAVSIDEQRPAMWQPPRHRRTLIVIDYDRGEPIMHTVEMYRSNRVDSYIVEIDGKPWRPRGCKRAGWSAVCDAVRRAMPRLASPRKMGVG